jgi:ATP-dependent Clp protease protease subunit
MKYQSEKKDMETFVSVNEELREVYLFGEVTSETAANMVPVLRALDAESHKNISLVLSSNGGLVDAGWAIYDVLCSLKSKVIASCFGQCMSIATLILQGCDTRLLSPNCRLMIHNISFGVEAEIQKIRLALTEEEFRNYRYCEVLGKRSNVPINKIVTMCNVDTYMSAEDAVKYGFADGVLK